MDLIVNDVMTNQVITTSEDETVKNAARVMAKFGISSLLVFNEKGLRGILTEHDLITRVVCTGLDPGKVKVSEVMSEPVIVVDPETPLDKAVEIMLFNKIKKLPVMTNEDEVFTLVGILSLVDVARLHPDLFNSLKEMVACDMESAEAGFYVS